jgi:hypothetical protein
MRSTRVPIRIVANEDKYRHESSGEQHMIIIAVDFSFLDVSRTYIVFIATCECLPMSQTTDYYQLATPSSPTTTNHRTKRLSSSHQTFLPPPSEFSTPSSSSSIVNVTLNDSSSHTVRSMNVSSTYTDERHRTS